MIFKYFQDTIAAAKPASLLKIIKLHYPAGPLQTAGPDMISYRQYILQWRFLVHRMLYSYWLAFCQGTTMSTACFVSRNRNGVVPIRKSPGCFI